LTGFLLPLNKEGDLTTSHSLLKITTITALQALGLRVLIVRQAVI